MIKRIYVDNYKCLVNFECKFDRSNLILGINGSGKTTVFDVLRTIQNIVTGASPISLFKETTLTRWQKRDVQVFELEIEGNDGVYKYRLEVEHEIGQDKRRIQLEKVLYNDKPIYLAKVGEIHLYNDEYIEGPTFSGDWTQSGLPFIGIRHDNKKITWLKNWFKQNLICIQIDPLHSKPMADATEVELDEHALNYVGWYRRRVSTDMNATINLYDSIKEMYEDFKGLTLEQQGGDVQHLFVNMGVQEERNSRPVFVPYSFGELSEGERALIILYTLLQLMSDLAMTLCLDEPDNFLSLAEIQPWLLKLKEAVDLYGSQAILISHHPELINNLAPRYGLVFEREKNGPVRVRRFQKDTEDESLSPSEIVARGWE